MIGELKQLIPSSTDKNRQETQHTSKVETPIQETMATPTNEQVIGEQLATSTAAATGDALATLDCTHTTPTTSAQTYALMEKHGMELPNNLSKVAPEFVEEINKFAETNEAFEKQIQALQSKPWRETVHSIRMIVENVAVKTIQTIVEAAQHNDWMELREHARSIGKLEEFEQRMGELIQSQNEYIKAGIKGPLNALERWASAPHHEIANIATGLGHLAYQISYKLAELEAAADLIEHGHIAEAEEIYARINAETTALAQAISTRLSSMSGPEIFEAITEFGTDCLLVGQVFKASSLVLRNARISNLSVDEYLTQLSQEVGCPIPQNARELVDAMSAKYPTQFQSAAVAGEAIARGQ